MEFVPAETSLTPSRAADQRTGSLALVGATRMYQDRTWSGSATRLNAEDAECVLEKEVRSDRFGELIGTLKGSSGA